ncbi:MAG: peptide deformylase [Candidatus Krumholzibacteria bacterium]|nr:peptide deformylase [Candidatus Krumholzibacteria bacterium]
MRIHIYGDPVLRKRGEKVTEFDDDLLVFLDDMAETMILEDGVGLAAPQVGVSKQIAVINREPGNSDTLLMVINPEITLFGDETESMDEGCLSVPGIRGKVTRSVSLEMTYQDEKGEQQELYAEGLEARIIQHELDHLGGVLFVDRLSIAKKVLIKGKLRELSKRGREGG